MKFKTLFSISAALMLLASCDGNKTTNIADLKDPTPGDSLMFYFGQNIGVDFWQSTMNDTTLRTQAAREDYLRGVKAGIGAVRENNAYNQGVYVGVQLAMNLKDFRENYPDLKVDDKVLLASLAGALEDEKAIDPAQAKAEFYKFLEGLSARKREADKEKSYALLQAKAKEMGMTQVAEGLYGKEIAAGSGNDLVDGDLVKMDITASTLSGEMVGMQFPEEVVVGRNYSSPIVSVALRSMKPGETKQFIVSPIDLTPRRYAQGEFRADSLLKFTIKVMSATPASASAPADSVK